jgi:chromosome partitioning protein
MSDVKGKKEAVSWAVASLKGGVSKTTTAGTIAHGLSLANRKVLLVDCDSQNHVRILFDLEKKTGLDSLLMNEISLDEAIVPFSDNLDIMPAGDTLSRAAREILLLDVRQEKELLRVLRPAKARYDYIIFDTSPGWDIILVNVFIAADYIIAPVTMQQLSIESFAKLLRRLKTIQEEKDGFGVDIVLPAIFDRRLKDARHYLEQIHKIVPGIIASPIRKTVKVEQAAKTILASLRPDIEPEGAAADYIEVIKRVIEVSENAR